MSFGGGSSGSSRISTSTDVALNNPSDGQVLLYNGTTAKWTNGTNTSAPVTSVANKTGAVTLAESDITGLAADLTARVTTTQIGAASGVASLDSSAKLPVGQMPTNGVLYVRESSGAYPNRPVYSGMVIWVGADAPATGGTTTGGTAAAVSGLDSWLRQG